AFRICVTSLIAARITAEQAVSKDYWISNNYVRHERSELLRHLLDTRGGDATATNDGDTPLSLSFSFVNHCPITQNRRDNRFWICRPRSSRVGFLRRVLP